LHTKVGVQEPRQGQKSRRERSLCHPPGPPESADLHAENRLRHEGQGLHRAIAGPAEAQPAHAHHRRRSRQTTPKRHHSRRFDHFQFGTVVQLAAAKR